MPALPGHHYCLAHQGNHSHYAEESCEVCKAQAEIERLRADQAKSGDEYRALMDRYDSRHEEIERLKAASLAVLSIVKDGRYPAVSLVDACRAIAALERALQPTEPTPRPS